MSDVQYFISPDGTKMAIVNAMEYNRIFNFSQQFHKQVGNMTPQAMQDVIDLVNMKTDWNDFVASGRHYIPLDVFERVLDGEHPVRVYREWRGYKAIDLAKMAGVNQGYLSQVENGKKIGTIHFYRKIAEILNVSLDDLAPA